MQARAAIRRAVYGALAALALVASGALAQTTDRPNALQQPLDDGCQRNPVGLLSFTSPEWVYVYRQPGARLLEGTARSTHTAGGDLPEGHDWYDLNSNVDPDPAFAYLVGGDPAAKNGNFSPGDEGTNRVHVEWETGTVPTYAWPTEADRVKYWGSWVWDCGHWGQGTGDPDFFLPGSNETPAEKIRGEQTELHPMRAMIITRASPPRPLSPESETDVFISTQGTPAFAEAQCAYENPQAAGPLGYGPGFTACLQLPEKQHQTVNDRDYGFFLPAPPRPAGRPHLRYRVVGMTDGKGPGENVSVAGNGINVTIPFDGFGTATETLRYGKSFFVGWEGGGGEQPTPLEIEVKRVKVIHSLDPNPDHPTSSGTPPGEWNMYLEVNGVWHLLNEWASGLGSVNDGDVISIGRKFQVSVPAGKGVRAFSHGRECDLPKINPCADTGEVADDNDSLGDSIENFSSAGAAVGDHTLRTANYELDYTVRRAPPGGACGADVFSPKSRFNRKRRGRRASRSRIVVKGRTSDLA